MRNPPIDTPPMKLAPILLLSAVSLATAGFPPSADTIAEAFSQRKGAFHMIRCSDGASYDFDAAESAMRSAPCSTFKIWNALLGLELGVISDPREPFYRWDGVERSVAAWNKDLDLRDAFQASCVPAFQDLARRIGRERMDAWIAQLGYGNGDTSSGLDVFWLPAEGRRPILISPREQAVLLCRLAEGKLPVSSASVDKLKQLMEIARTERGVLYGKTGTSGSNDMGWFVGLVESGGETYAFACTLRASDTSGLDARKAAQTILERAGFL
jgi:beta-lactamase class D